MQTSAYFTNHAHKDGWVLKLLVLWTLIMDTAAKVCIFMSVYWPLVSHWGNEILLFTPATATHVQILLSGLVATPVQLFFTFRLWRFSGKQWWVPVVLVPAALYQPVADILFLFAVFSSDRTVTGIANKGGAYAISGNAVAAGVDIIIAVGMSIRLLRTPTEMAQSKGIVNRLLAITLNTGIWTALGSILCVATFIQLPGNNLTYVAFFVIVCPLYCNSLLGNLNSREYVRNGMTSSKTASNLGASTVSRGMIFEDNVMRIGVNNTVELTVDHTPSGMYRPRDNKDQFPMHVL